MKSIVSRTSNTSSSRVCNACTTCCTCNTLRSGQTVVEVIVAMTLFAILATGSVVVILGSFLTSRQGEEEARAAFLAQEGLEAVESIRNRGWATLVDGSYGLSTSGTTWSFSGTSQVIEKYTRVIQVSSVSRNASGDIVTTGGTVDPNTKRVESRVTWNFVPTSTNTVRMTQLMTNWQTAMINAPAIPPTPTPTPSSCATLCANFGYVNGVCRANGTACTNNSEVRIAQGDTFCNAGLGGAACCCDPT